MDINGVIPPMVTPVEDRSGTIAIDELRQLTNRLVKNGVHGLFPCGTTGEFSSLSRSDRTTIIQTVSNSADSVPVLAGCGGTSRSEVLSLIDDAEKAGADAAVVVLPYYLPGSPEGFEEFYSNIADDSSLPIILYHIPSRTGQELPVATVQALAEHPAIHGIKDSSGDVGYLFELVRSTPESFSVLQGGVIDSPTVFRLGIDGIVPGEANYMPSTLVNVYSSFVDNNDEAMMDALRSTIEIGRSFREIPLIPGIKYLTTYSGIDVGPSLPPLPTLNEEMKRELRVRFDESME